MSVGSAVAAFFSKYPSHESICFAAFADGILFAFPFRTFFFFVQIPRCLLLTIK